MSWPLYPRKRYVQPAQVLCKRTPATELLRRHTLPECKKANRATSVVDTYAPTVERAANRGLIDLQCRLQSIVPLGVEQEVTKVGVAIGPARAIVVKHPEYFACVGIDRDVVQAKITVNQDTIFATSHKAVMQSKNTIRLRQKADIADHVRQSLPDPIARFGPSQPLR